MPGVSRNSIGYGQLMITGIPGGRQFAVWSSSTPLASRAFFLAAYSGVNDNVAGGPIRPRVGPSGISQTPPKSGSFEIASQSASLGAGRGNV